MKYAKWVDRASVWFVVEFYDYCSAGCRAARRADAGSRRSLTGPAVTADGSTGAWKRPNDPEAASTAKSTAAPGVDEPAVDVKAQWAVIYAM
jgi:hypothetical protein